MDMRLPKEPVPKPATPSAKRAFRRSNSVESSPDESSDDDLFVNEQPIIDPDYKIGDKVPLREAFFREHRKLFTIPEDNQIRSAGVEEPVYHRSPVSLENGYRPTFAAFVNAVEEEEQDEYDDSLDDEEQSVDESSTDEEEVLVVRRVVGHHGTSAFRQFQEGLCRTARSLLYCVVVGGTLVILAVAALLLVYVAEEPERAVQIDRYTSPLRNDICLPGDNIFDNTSLTVDTPDAASPGVPEAPTPEAPVPEAAITEATNSIEGTQTPGPTPDITPIPEPDSSSVAKDSIETHTVTEEVQVDRETEQPAADSDGRYVVKAVPKEAKPKLDETEVEVDTATSASLEPVETGLSEEPLETGLEEDKENDTVGNKTDIPSFREWAQKALEEEEKKKGEKKKNGHAASSPERNATQKTSSPPGRRGPTQVLKKNFASLDCGAKVVAANAESTGAYNLISPSRDEYMLNKCTDRAWFVVELCESIKGMKVEIANFELYSSVPNAIRVSMAQSFPTKDWVLFGNFNMEEDRSIQTFSADEDVGVFGRFVKVEILSHHGNEHYCPVSIFKIFGISEIELMAQEDDDDDDDNPDDDGDTEQPGPGQPSFLVNFIKEKVEFTIDRVVGVFRSRSSESDMLLALNQTSLEGNTFMFRITCPDCDIERSRNVYYLLSSKYGELTKALENRFFRHVLETSVCESYGFNISKDMVDFKSYTTCTSFQLVEFYKTLFGTTHMLALCNSIIAENGGLPQVTQVTAPNRVEEIREEKINATDVNNEETGFVLVNVPTNVTAEASDTPSSAEKTESPAEEKQVPEQPADESPEQPAPRGTQPSTDSAPAVPVVPEPEPEPKPGPGGSAPPQKESVWQKLANRIKSLERNVTLSSGYLEELSVQYKKQIEDLQLSMRQVSENMAALVKTKDEETKEMQKQVVELTDMVLRLSAQVDNMNSWAVGAHAVFIVVEAVVGVLFILACCSRRKAPQVLTSPTPIKRRHSVPNQKLEGRVESVPSAAEASLSRRARKRLLRKMAKADRISEDGYYTYHTGDRPGDHPLDFEQKLRRAGSDPNVSKHFKLNNNSTRFKVTPIPPVEVSNMFGVLNNSLHDDPSPVKRRALAAPSGDQRMVNGDQLREDQKLVNGDKVVHEDHKMVNGFNGDHDYCGSDSDRGRKSTKRSKSTSPTREAYTTKQKTLFKNFNPDDLEWTTKKQ